MSDNYDLIVIGGGPGGIAAAQAAAARKKRVAVLEKDGWGGTCTHRGCIPTKALLACSRFYTDLKKLKRVGVAVSEAAVDFSAMKKHRDQMVRMRDRLLSDLRDQSDPRACGRGWVFDCYPYFGHPHIDIGPVRFPDCQAYQSRYVPAGQPRPAMHAVGEWARWIGGCEACQSPRDGV